MKKIILLALVFLFCCPLAKTPITAQGIRTSYFMDTYSHRHALNPALTPRWGYLYIPGAGPLSLDLKMPFSLETVLYPQPGGQLATFLHPNVSADEFLSKIKKNNRMFMDLSYTPISFGFFHESSFWSVDVSVKNNLDFNLPGELFRFLKLGMTSSSTAYNLANLSVDETAYAEIAIGHSRNINANWRVGGKLKFLVGAASLRVNIADMQINMGQDQWDIHSNASLKAMGNSLSFLTDSSGAINDFDINPKGPAGYGAAIDLGFEYQFPEEALFKGVRLSFGITDLGFIRYSAQNSHIAFANGDVTYKGFEDLTLDSMNVGDQVNTLVDGLMSMANFRETAPHATTQFLTARMNAGIEYAFLRNKMSVGLLSSTRFGLSRAISDLTLSFNLRPAEWFGLSASYSFLQGKGHSIGWSLNLTPRWGLNLFLGTDYNFFRVNSQFIPYAAQNLNIHFGLSIPIGNNRNTLKEPKFSRNNTYEDDNLYYEDPSDQTSEEPSEEPSNEPTE